MRARRVLLISTNRYDSPFPVFPLGLAFIDAALRPHGYVTRWLDLLAEPQGLPAALSEFQPDFVGISVRNIDDVVIQKQATFFDELRALCDTIRQTSPCRIILGGSGFSIFPEALLELSGADYGITGEGEQSFVELLGSLVEGDDRSAIPGLVYRDHGPIKHNPQSRIPPPPALDVAALPAELTRYYLDTSSMLSVQTQRGCPFHCSYCTYPIIEGKIARRRAPHSVVEEMAQLKARGAPYIFIVDSVFNCSAEHVAQVCEELVRRDLKLKWGCFLRPEGLTLDLMRLMSRAGLAHIEFGTDSFCDSVLYAYGKHFTFEDIQNSSELAARESIDFCHFLICGGPGETDATLQESYVNSRRLPEGVIMPMIGMRVYPGTPLHQSLLAQQPDAGNDWVEQSEARRARSDAPDLKLHPANLLAPYYYLAPGLSQEHITGRLEEFARQSPNWIFGEPPPTYRQMAEKLRQRGVVGPLWGYFAAMRRIMPPQPVVSANL